MPGRTSIAPGTRQIVDTGEGPTIVTAGSVASVGAFGVIWPLLPNQTLKIFNVSLNVVPDTDLVFEVFSGYIYLQLLDGADNPIASGPDEVSTDISLAFWNSGGGVPAPTIVGPDGFNIAANGDPIIEIASNLLVVNSSSVGAGVAKVQLGGAFDMKNTDASDHTVQAAFFGLISFEAR